MTSENNALQELRARAQDPAPITWLFLGDSITHGNLHTHGMRDYVGHFAERVRYQHWRSFDAVINMAIGGYTVPQLSAALDQCCMRFNPDIVSIAIGVNDSVPGLDSLASFEDSYLAVIERIQRETSAQLFLQIMNPVHPGWRSDLSAYPKFVEAIRQIAAQKQLPLCDHYKVWEEYAKQQGKFMAFLMSDPVHPNGVGHQLIANTLLKWIGYGPLDRIDPLEGFDPEP